MLLLLSDSSPPCSARRSEALIAPVAEIEAVDASSAAGNRSSAALLEVGGVASRLLLAMASGRMHGFAVRYSARLHVYACLSWSRTKNISTAGRLWIQDSGNDGGEKCMRDIL